MIRRLILTLSLLSIGTLTAFAANDALLIPKGAKVYIAPQDGFENYLSAALLKKAVPVSIVANRERADFEITGNAKTDKAGWAKTLFTGSTKSDEHASITVTNITSGIVVYAYAYNMSSAFNGQQSSAESCAKHFKERIEKGK